MEKTQKQFRKRNAILSCLQQTKAHPSAEWIYASLKPQIPDLSLGTVYRNLALFKEQGLITSLGTVQGVERFDAETAPHVHHICCQCGKVQDMEQIRVPGELCQAAEKEAGGQVVSCQLTFTGYCGECEKEKELN